MVELNNDIGVCVNAVPTTTNITNRFDDLEERLQKDIQDKFGFCYKLIARAKWKQKFGTRHYASKTYGRWNK